MIDMGTQRVVRHYDEFSVIKSVHSGGANFQQVSELMFYGYLPNEYEHISPILYGVESDSSMILEYCEPFEISKFHPKYTSLMGDVSFEQPKHIRDFFAETFFNICSDEGVDETIFEVHDYYSYLDMGEIAQNCFAIYGTFEPLKNLLSDLKNLTIALSYEHEDLDINLLRDFTLSNLGISPDGQLKMVDMGYGIRPKRRK